MGTATATATAVKEMAIASHNVWNEIAATHNAYEAVLDEGGAVVSNFFERRAAERQVKVTFFAAKGERHGRTWVLPACVQDDTLDVCGQAALLQDLEDEWNDQHPHPPMMALLQPC